MNKGFYLYVVYADCGINAKGFNPVVFRLNFYNENDLVKWMNDSNNLKAAVNFHAELSGAKPSGFFLKSVYIDSDMREALGIWDNGSNLGDTIARLFNRWFSIKQQSGVFPMV